MQYEIKPMDGYLKAEMRGRETADETKEFVAAILEAVKQHQATKVLISIRDSRAIFKLEDWKFSEALDEALRTAKLRVAFIADSKDVRMSQQYIALVASQRGFDFRAFVSEAEATAWLRGP